MLTTFSMAAARNFPLTLQATGARLGSPGEPRVLEHSSGELSLRTHTHSQSHRHILTLHYSTLHKARKSGQAQGKVGRTHVLLKTNVCCSVYWFLFTFQTRTVPSLPLVAKSPFLLHHPQEITYEKHQRRWKQNIFRLVEILLWLFIIKKKKFPYENTDKKRWQNIATKKKSVSCFYKSTSKHCLLVPYSSPCDLLCSGEPLAW